MGVQEFLLRHAGQAFANTSNLHAPSTEQGIVEHVARSDKSEAGREARWADCELVSAEDPDIPVGPFFTETMGASSSIVRACR